MLYCTRKNVHIDRCASGWLIRRFLDSDAAFAFVENDDPLVEGAIPFNMHGVDWGRHGNRRKFETIIERHGLGESDRVL